jgi:alkylation response protein AidB-like acyl-CoA dehydrogenase
MIDCEAGFQPRGDSMDLSYSAEYEAFRVDVAKFLAASWPLKGKEAELSPDQKASLFRGRAIEAGYLARSVPKRYGGSEQAPDVLRGQIIREEFFRARAPGDLAGIGPSMLVPTLLEKGAEWQKEKFIGPTIRGEIVWCQAGSPAGQRSADAPEIVDGDGYQRPRSTSGATWPTFCQLHGRDAPTSRASLPAPVKQRA